MTRYRAAMAAATSGGVCRRVLTDRAELRVGDGEDERLVSGVAVRYGDEAHIWGIRERVRAGALSIEPGPANCTRQHNRDIPLGLIEWQDDEDAMRFRSRFIEGAAQDQALADIRAGLLRGASIEFVPVRDRSEDDLIEILEAKLLRVSVVDDGAYPASTIAVPSARKRQLEWWR